MAGSMILWGLIAWGVYSLIVHAGGQMKDKPKDWWDI